jgi:subtilase family serine protease
MNTYRQMFGIPPCTTANKCFTKVDQKGGTNFPIPNIRGAGETSLDLDMVSAICQNCHIILVEANALTAADLGAAENEAVKLGADEVSNSFGGPESSSDAQFCSQFFDHPGVVITASSGDSGSPDVENPANCPNVVSVGGTTLKTDGTETAWNTSATEGAGGGCSTVFAIPPWQAQAVKQGKVTTNCAKRAGADVSAVADPATGVLVVDTFGHPFKSHFKVGGTSASAPIIAAVYALAGGAKNAASGAIIPWTQAAQGANCLNTVGGKAYSFQTGLGTPNGISCF